MARLPHVGGDAGNWGEILNEYLSRAHEADGSLKPIPHANIQGLGTAATKDASMFATSTQGTKADNAIANTTEARAMLAKSSELEGAFTARRVHVVAADGQSNMSGRGTPINSSAGVGADATHARIFQYPGRGSKTHMFIAAAEPLTMHDSASGMGPALQFARNLIADLPEDDVIVIVPNAHGGTMLSTNDTLGWRWGIAGNLSAQAVTLTQSALEAAATQWPMAKVTLDAVLWFQGETDGTNSTPPTTYTTDLDALIAGYRTAYVNSALPFIICQMIPESITASSARALIDQVHRNTPWRMPHTGIVLNDKVGMNQDALHANAQAHRQIYGPGLLAEFKRIKSGRLPVNANPYGSAFGPVSGVVAGTATNAHSVPISWTALAGASSYQIEYQEPGSTVWTIAGTTTGTSFVLGALAPATTYSVSIVAINTSGEAGFRSAVVTGNTLSAINIVTDSFTRTASTLGNADTGQAWTALTGSFLTTGSQAYHGSTTNALAVLNSGVADGIVKVTFSVIASLERLAFRGDGTKDNYWFIQQRSSANAYQLYKTTAGTYAQVGSNTQIVPMDNDIVEVSMTGSQIAVRVNGALVFRVEDTFQQAGTYIGLGGSTTNTARFDNYSLVA